MAQRGRSRDRRGGTYWESMVNKYEKRNYELEERECELRHRLEMMECTTPAILLFNMWKMMQTNPNMDIVQQLKEMKLRSSNGAAKCKCGNAKCRCGATRQSQPKPEKPKRPSQNSRGGGCRCGCAGGGGGGGGGGGYILENVESLQSADLELMQCIADLRDHETKMKKRIQELEHKENAYLETLKQADLIWAQMEGGFKKRISDAEANEATIRKELEEVTAEQAPVDRVQELEESERQLKERVETLEQEKARLQEMYDELAARKALEAAEAAEAEETTEEPTADEEVNEEPGPEVEEEPELDEEPVLEVEEEPSPEVEEVAGLDEEVCEPETVEETPVDEECTPETCEEGGRDAEEDVADTDEEAASPKWDTCPALCTTSAPEGAPCAVPCPAPCHNREAVCDTIPEEDEGAEQDADIESVTCPGEPECDGGESVAGDEGAFEPSEAGDVGAAEPSEAGDVGAAEPSEAGDVGATEPSAAGDVGGAEASEAGDVGGAEASEAGDVGGAEASEAGDVGGAEASEAGDAASVAASAAAEASEAGDAASVAASAAAEASEAGDAASVAASVAAAEASEAGDAESVAASVAAAEAEQAAKSGDAGDAGGEETVTTAAADVAGAGADVVEETIIIEECTPIGAASPEQYEGDLSGGEALEDLVDLLEEVKTSASRIASLSEKISSVLSGGEGDGGGVEVEGEVGEGEEVGGEEVEGEVGGEGEEGEGEGEGEAIPDIIVTEEGEEEGEGEGEAPPRPEVCVCNGPDEPTICVCDGTSTTALISAATSAACTCAESTVQVPSQVPSGRESQGVLCICTGESTATSTVAVPSGCVCVDQAAQFPSLSTAAVSGRSSRATSCRCAESQTQMGSEPVPQEPRPSTVPLTGKACTCDSAAGPIETEGGDELKNVLTKAHGEVICTLDNANRDIQRALDQANRDVESALTSLKGRSTGGRPSSAPSACTCATLRSDNTYRPQSASSRMQSSCMCSMAASVSQALCVCQSGGGGGGGGGGPCYNPSQQQQPQYGGYPCPVYQPPQMPAPFVCPPPCPPPGGFQQAQPFVCPPPCPGPQQPPPMPMYPPPPAPFVCPPTCGGANGMPMYPPPPPAAPFVCPPTCGGANGYQPPYQPPCPALELCLRSLQQPPPPPPPLPKTVCEKSTCPTRRHSSCVGTSMPPSEKPSCVGVPTEETLVVKAPSMRLSRSASRVTIREEPEDSIKASSGEPSVHEIFSQKFEESGGGEGGDSVAEISALSEHASAADISEVMSEVPETSISLDLEIRDSQTAEPPPSEGQPSVTSAQKSSAGRSGGSRGSQAISVSMRSRTASQRSVASKIPSSVSKTPPCETPRDDASRKTAQRRGSRSPSGSFAKPPAPTKGAYHGKNCNCPICKCSPCQDPNVKPQTGAPKPRPSRMSTSSVQKSKRCPVCRCTVCRCPDCIDPNKTKGDTSYAGKPCDCPPGDCQCDPCNDPRRRKPPKPCTCVGVCTCKPCQDPNKASNAPSATKSAITPSAASKVASSATTAKTSAATTKAPSAAASKAPSAAPSKTGDKTCTCEGECTCKPCADTSKALGSKTCSCKGPCLCKPCADPNKAPASPGTAPGEAAKSADLAAPGTSPGEAAKSTDLAAPGTRALSPDNEYESNVQAVNIGGKTINIVFPTDRDPNATQMIVAPYVHPPDCDCQICQCKPCSRGRYTEFKEKPAGHPEFCDCPECQCQPCDRVKPTNSTPTQPGEGTEIKEKPAGHPEFCDCPECQCQPCDRIKPTDGTPTQPGEPDNNGPYISTEVCDCEVCKCDYCPKGIAESALKTAAQSEQPVSTEVCDCQICKCDFCPTGPETQASALKKEVGAKSPEAAAEKTTTGGQGIQGHSPLCKCPECTNAKCKHREVATDNAVEGVTDSTEAEKKAVHMAGCKCTECTNAQCKYRQSSTAAGKDVPVKLPASRIGPSSFIKSRGSSKFEVEIPCACGTDAFAGTDVATKEEGNEEWRKLDNEALMRRVYELEKEVRERANEIAQIRKFMDSLQCSCEAAQAAGPTDSQMNNAFMVPGTSRSFAETMSGLQCAMTFLQEKCAKKDRMIAAMTAELRLRADSGVFEDLLKDVADKSEKPCSCDQPKVDFDRTAVTKSLPTPKDIQKPQVMKTIAEKPCGQAPAAKVAVGGGGRGTCVCDTSIDPSPLAVIEVRRISTDSILVKWDRPNSKQIKGYEIEINGYVKSRVHSAARCVSIVHSVDMDCDKLVISVFAMSVLGARCQPPATAIFQPKLKLEAPRNEVPKGNGPFSCGPKDETPKVNGSFSCGPKDETPKVNGSFSSGPKDEIPNDIGSSSSCGC